MGLLLAVAACGWALAQACTLLWQAGDTARLQQRIDRGLPLHAWDLADAGAIVGPGSEGLDGSRRTEHGLRPSDTAAVLDLSLALHGRALPLPQYAAARLALASEVPFRARLLVPARDGTVLAGAWVGAAAGERSVRLPVPADAAGDARWLRLRLERTAAGTLALQQLALIEPRCGPPANGNPGPVGPLQTIPAECPGSTPRLLPWQVTPEAFLRLRDEGWHAAPGTLLMPAHVPGRWARAIAAVRAAPALPLAGLLAALLVLAWAVHARVRGNATRSARQLVLLLGVPVLLLCLGQPDRRDEPLVLAAFLASCLAALLHPGGRRDWRWLGDAAAWRAAARFTVAAAGLVAVLGLIGWALGLAPGEFRADRVPRYLAWALLQQALLLVAITPRMASGGHDRWTTAVSSGGVFALLHLPNSGLMLATLLAGMAWSRLGQRHGALLPLALSHAVLGTLLVWAATPWLLRSAEVGGRFLMAG